MDKIKIAETIINILDSMFIDIFVIPVIIAVGFIIMFAIKDKRSGKRFVILGIVSLLLGIFRCLIAKIPLDMLQLWFITGLASPSLGFIMYMISDRIYLSQKFKGARKAK